MKRFYVIANYDKPFVNEAIHEVRQVLDQAGASCRVAPPGTAGEHYHFTDPSQIPVDTECVLVLGGDGTMLQAAHDTLPLHIPLLGINLGSLGYLADVERDRIRPALSALLLGEYSIEQRMLLGGEIMREGKVLMHGTALNDIVLSRCETLNMITFSLAIDGQKVTGYHADGMVVATPTGSTAYSLSAGGPFVLPTSRLMVLTPLSPHTLLNDRSIVLPDSAKVTLTIEERPGKKQMHPAVAFDADNQVNLQVGDSIRIHAAEETVRLIRLDKDSFFAALSRKLN